MCDLNPHVKLAILAIEGYVRTGCTIEVPGDTPEELLSTKAGAFVCIKIDGELRGCIGTIEPIQENLAREIVENAISAATMDPRFTCVQVEELEFLEFSVDVLSPRELVTDIRELDPKRYGVVVENGPRKGLLLPDLDGIDSVEEQIDIAKHKAFIKTTEPIKLYRFEVKRYQ